MARKKKDAPSFDVPDAVRHTGPTGWVYRSDDSPAMKPSAPPPPATAAPAAVAPAPAAVEAPAQTGTVLQMKSAAAAQAAHAPSAVQQAAARPATPVAGSAATPQRLPEFVMIAVRFVTFPLRLGIAAAYGFISGATDFIANETKA